MQRGGRRNVRYELCRSVARRTYGAFVAQTGRREPPVPVHELVQWLGYQVVYLCAVDDACSAIVSTRDRLIGINANHSRRRQRFSIGHEAGHILLKHPPETRCTSADIAHYNAEADTVAAELLMPHDLIDDWLEKSHNLRVLADTFDVSEEAMQRRLNELAGPRPEHSSRHIGT